MDKVKVFLRGALCVVAGALAIGLAIWMLQGLLELKLDPGNCGTGMNGRGHCYPDRVGNGPVMLIGYPLVLITLSMGFLTVVLSSITCAKALFSKGVTT